MLCTLRVGKERASNTLTAMVTKMVPIHFKMGPRADVTLLCIQPFVSNFPQESTCYFKEEKKKDLTKKFYMATLYIFWGILTKQGPVRVVIFRKLYRNKSVAFACIVKDTKCKHELLRS